jgi:hypothetical protein
VLPVGPALKEQAIGLGHAVNAVRQRLHRSALSSGKLNRARAQRQSMSRELRRQLKRRVSDDHSDAARRSTLEQEVATGVAPEMRQALANYRAELAALSVEELIARYEAEKQREYEQLVAKAEKEERERFFNQPHAAADFVHWSKMAHWTLDEAVALSFGKAPEVVNWEQVRKYLQLSPFAVEYMRRREIAVRAASWKQLYDPVLPTIFLAWAKRIEIEVPAALVEAVAKRDRIADWKSMYDELVATYEEREKVWQDALETREGLTTSLQLRITELEAQRVNESPEKSLGTRERDTLLKIVIGMAREGYKYDPKSSRSNIPQEIADDLAKHGIPLDVDTVRKWLRQAAEFLPGE